MNVSRTGPDDLGLHEPTPLEMQLARRQRLKAGLVYGLLLSVVYALVAATIDVLTFPDLPLKVDWPAASREVLFTVLGSLVLSAITAWPEANLKGMMFGAGAIMVWEMFRSFLQLGARWVILLLLALPLVVVSLPIAAVFRWAVHMHIHHLQDRRLVWRAGLVLAVMGVGAFAGSWSRMPGNAEDAVRRVNTMLQKTLADKGGDLPTPLRTVPGFYQSVGQTYKLSQQASAASPTGVDVQATFDNGYIITCFVDTASSTAACAEGAQSPFGAARYNSGDQR